MTEYRDNLPDEQYIIGPKNVTITPGGNVFAHSIKFDSTDFSVTGRAKIGGIFSLEIHIVNNALTAFYVGVVLYSANEVVTPIDRAHIGYVARGDTVVISGQTIPSLSAIKTSASRPIDRIDITLDIVEDQAVSGGDVSVYLRISSASRALSAPPYIGSDASVFNPGIFDTASIYHQSIAANAANAVILANTTILPYPVRMRIDSININIYPMPYPGDIEIFVNIVRPSVTNPIAIIVSRTDEVVNWLYQQQLHLNSGDYVRITANNNNTGVAGQVDAYVVGEIVYD